MGRPVGRSVGEKLGLFVGFLLRFLVGEEVVGFVDGSSVISCGMSSASDSANDARKSNAELCSSLLLLASAGAAGLQGPSNRLKEEHAVFADRHIKNTRSRPEAADILATPQTSYSTKQSNKHTRKKIQKKNHTDDEDHCWKRFTNCRARVLSYQTVQLEVFHSEENAMSERRGSPEGMLCLQFCLLTIITRPV